MSKEIEITKPIRLIELFAGYGSQAMALKRIGADFESWRVVENDKYAVKSYNAVHDTNYKPMDIRQIHADDLCVTDTDSYVYMMTYSFPCTDLSVAGRRAGMEEGSGTASSLLWEVKRILIELSESDSNELPQILFMENVPQVHGKQNIDSFNRWIEFLGNLGYVSYWKDLNAKDFGVAQNRNRCFMFSFLGDYTYEFPVGGALSLLLDDYLEPTENIKDNFYMNNAKADLFIRGLISSGVLPAVITGGVGCAQMVPSRTQRDEVSQIVLPQRIEAYQTIRPATHSLSSGDISIKKLGNIYGHMGGSYAGSVYSRHGLSPAIKTFQGGNTQPMVIEIIEV